MELFIALDEEFDPSTGLMISGGRTIRNLYDCMDYDTLSGMVISTSNMLGKIAPACGPYYELLIDNIEKIFRNDHFYLFKAHPSIEQIIRTRHTGKDLVGEKIVVCNPISLVYTDRDGNGWYISDAPVKDNRCSPMRIVNKGNGYFEYFDNNTALGSEYYIEAFKNWK